MTHVFCFTDFSVASHTDFPHALKGRLTHMHVAGAAAEDTGGFSGVRAQLERWVRLRVSSAETAVAGLGIIAEKVLGREGAPSRRRILIPVCTQPALQPAVRAIVDLLQACGLVDPTLTLFHAGAEPDMPAMEIPAQDTALTFTRLARPGDPVDRILAAARETATDLAIMSTAGHHGFLDTLRGSTTERVLRKLSCPLLTVPGGRV
jgi:nucleotide-binding universal stress UspA family protein